MLDPNQRQAMEDQLRQLTEAAARGDAEAMNALLARYLPELRAYVRLNSGKLIRSRENHSDIVQSVCREVLQNAERFKYPRESAFKFWLFTTAQRKIGHRHKYYRADKRNVGREVDMSKADSAASEAGLLDCYRTFSTPSGVAMAHEELERIESAFEKLPETQREVITLAHVVGLSRAEIAEQTGRSEGAVRVMLHRALAQLSDMLCSDKPSKP